MVMGVVETVLGVLAVWRVTHLIQAEVGPWQLMLRLRRAAGTGFWGELLDCFYCLSVWVALPAAFLIGHNWREWVLLWLGLSGGAILLQRATTPAAPFVEDRPQPQEERDAVLRPGEEATRPGEEPKPS
jgi:hypothetical protein